MAARASPHSRGFGVRSRRKIPGKFSLGSTIFKPWNLASRPGVTPLWHRASKLFSQLPSLLGSRSDIAFARSFPIGVIWPRDSDVTFSKTLDGIFLLRTS